MNRSSFLPAPRRVKDWAIALLHPLRQPVSWACQHRLLPSRVRRVLPWRWALEPFTIYGNGWRAQWFPAEFDDITHEIFWSGVHSYEKETIPVILDEIRRGLCFVDIGANCGIYTVLAATINRHVRLSRSNRYLNSMRRWSTMSKKQFEFAGDYPELRRRQCRRHRRFSRGRRYKNGKLGGRRLSGPSGPGYPCRMPDAGFDRRRVEYRARFRKNRRGRLFRCRSERSEPITR